MFCRKIRLSSMPAPIASVHGVLGGFRYYLLQQHLRRHMQKIGLSIALKGEFVHQLVLQVFFFCATKYFRYSDIHKANRLGIVRLIVWVNHHILCPENSAGSRQEHIIALNHGPKATDRSTRKAWAPPSKPIAYRYNILGLMLVKWLCLILNQRNW